MRICTQSHSPKWKTRRVFCDMFERRVSHRKRDGSGSIKWVWQSLWNTLNATQCTMIAIRWCLRGKCFIFPKFFLLLSRPIVASFWDSLYSRGDEDVRLSTPHQPPVSTDWCPTLAPSLLFHKLHTNCNTCKPLAYMHSLHAHTHTVLPHSDSWSVTLLARHPERRRRGGQKGSSRQRGRGVCFSTFSHGARAKCRLHSN